MICSSRLKNYYRDKKENVSLDDEENPVDVSSGELIEDAVLMEERSRMLHDAISKLPERQQQAVRLKYFRNMSAADIAAELGTTAGNVRVILNRSMDKLKEFLADYYA
ncbi:MAG: sigma-70 family RNA polymerase sigma factor [Ruminococcaceae bacterium]|jgi:RNA polymerase sigma factor (sigma-70 family)|nr:sigma-70 family RNA polymerase sigma factor [Oscillospiraceae bacterium]